MRIAVQTTFSTATPGASGGDGAVLFAKRVAEITGGQIRLLIKEPRSLVQPDEILDAQRASSRS